jgi:hypothetical protein
MPGTRATVISSTLVIAKPPSCLRIWIFASVLTDSAFVPPWASMCPSCIE